MTRAFEAGVPMPKSISSLFEEERFDYPSQEEIMAVLAQPDRQAAVSRRLQAPFDYLPAEHQAGRRASDRQAISLMRKAWVFDEPVVQLVKEKLDHKALKTRKKFITPAMAQEFLDDYFRLLAESCVLQKTIADGLAHGGPEDGPAYAASVEQAMARPDKYRLLTSAIGLYRRTHEHELKRFAYGSTLKAVMDGLVDRLPAAWHRIAMTPRRGEMVRRFDSDMLDYRSDPDPDARRRIIETYFNGNVEEAEKAFTKVMDLPDEVFHQRRKERDGQIARLESMALKVGYGQMGQEPDLPGLSQDQRSALHVLDDLLWVDNDIEKVLDQKMLLEHDIYLRLHLGNLLIACYPTLERPSFEGLKPEDREKCEKMMDGLVRRFGRGAFIFGIPDTVLERRLALIEPKLSGRLVYEDEKRVSSSNPFRA